MKRYCLTVNLKNDPVLIGEYEAHHRQVWPEITDAIKASGIVAMEIYRVGTRLFMIMETTEDFSFEQKQGMDASNPRVAEWENLMWKYQEPLGQAAPGEKWVLMNKIFDLEAS